MAGLVSCQLLVPALAFSNWIGFVEYPGKLDEIKMNVPMITARPVLWIGISKCAITAAGPGQETIAFISQSNVQGMAYPTTNPTLWLSFVP